jgi:NADH-quinone oxidoreductase subunit M
VHSSWWLTALLLVPLVGAGVVLALRRNGPAAFLAGAVTGGVELALSLVVALVYSGHLFAAGCPTGDTCASGVDTMTTFDFAHRVVVASSFGFAYDVGIDGISVVLVALTGIVVFLALVGARERRSEPAFVAWLLLLTTATMGAFITRDLLDFFLFFELTLIPSYFMIAGWGSAQRAAAALKFFVYTLAGSAFLLVGILYLAFAHQHADGGALTFSYAVIQQSALSHGAAVWVFVAFLIAFAVKSPLFPLHTWSPLAYAEAPTGGSVVLSGLLSKLGTYGLLRFGVLLLPAALPTVQPYLLTVAVVTILYGSFLAAVAKDLKRLVAYSSLAQVGFIVLGIASGTQIGTEGAVLLMFNHGVIVAGLFLLVGWIEHRRHTIQIADLKGLQRHAPVLAGAFTVVMMASIGLPGLSGFVSEILILLGTFTAHRWWAIVATTGVVFAALYLLWAYQRVFQGKAEGENAQVADATPTERWVLVPVIALVVILGVFPRPALERINPTITHDVAAVVTTTQQAP